MRLRLILTFMVGLLAAYVPAWGDAVIVNNSSFENLPAGGFESSSWGYWEVGAVPEWNCEGVCGLLSTTVSLNYLPDGPTVGFVNGGAVLYQAVAYATANTTYTLSVDVGARNDEPFDGSVGLSVNGVLHMATATAPTPGNWSTYNFVYTTINPDVGGLIYIDLFNASGQAEFDNVQLTSAPDVPEPASGTLFCVLFVGLGVYRRTARRRPSSAP